MFGVTSRDILSRFDGKLFWSQLPASELPPEPTTTRERLPPQAAKRRRVEVDRPLSPPRREVREVSEGPPHQEGAPTLYQPRATVLPHWVEGEEGRPPSRSRSTDRDRHSPPRYRDARGPPRYDPRDSYPAVQGRRSRSPPMGRRSRSPPMGRRSRSPLMGRRSRSPPMGRRSRSPPMGRMRAPSPEPPRYPPRRGSRSRSPSPRDHGYGMPYDRMPPRDPRGPRYDGR